MSSRIHLSEEDKSIIAYGLMAYKREIKDAITYIHHDDRDHGYYAEELAIVDALADGLNLSEDHFKREGVNHG